MSQGVRVIGPDRAQLRWDIVELDSRLADDHRARLVWAFVEGLDLSEFYNRIKARDAVAGRPMTRPAEKRDWVTPSSAGKTKERGAASNYLKCRSTSSKGLAERERSQ